MLRSVFFFAFRFTVLAVVFVVIARSQMGARRARQSSSGSLRGDNPDLDGVLRKGEIGLDARPGRRVR